MEMLGIDFLQLLGVLQDSAVLVFLALFAVPI
jgi:hypothetical protein